MLTGALAVAHALAAHATSQGVGHVASQVAQAIGPAVVSGTAGAVVRKALDSLPSSSQDGACGEDTCRARGAEAPDPLLYVRYRGRHCLE